MIDFKSMLKAVIAVLVPFFFTMLIAKYPDFPLTADQLVSLVLWLVGLVIGGWQAAKVYHRAKGLMK